MWCYDVCVVSSGVAFVRRREWDGASVWLSRGFVGSSSALLSRSSDASGSVVSWTASVESACGHPAVSPTSSAFYSSGSGALRDSDFAVFFSFVGRLVRSLSLSAPLSRNPAFPFQRAPSGLPESMIQLEQQWSSFALTRLFGNDS